MTDPVEQKELREEIITALWEHDEGAGWNMSVETRADYEANADAVLAVVEPRVISLAGEVERLTDANGLRRALYEVGVTAWSCSICGPHKGSSGRWCDAGCGSDYNQMTPLWSFDAIAAALSPLPSERKGL